MNGVCSIRPISVSEYVHTSARYKNKLTVNKKRCSLLSLHGYVCSPCYCLYVSTSFIPANIWSTVSRIILNLTMNNIQKRFGICCISYPPRLPTLPLSICVLSPLSLFYYPWRTQAWRCRVPIFIRIWGLFLSTFMVNEINANPWWSEVTYYNSSLIIIRQIKLCQQQSQRRLTVLHVSMNFSEYVIVVTFMPADRHQPPTWFTGNLNLERNI